MTRKLQILAVLALIGCATAVAAQGESSAGPLRTRLVRSSLRLTQPLPGLTEPAELLATDTLRRASVGGKYRTLLFAIRVPQDQSTYTSFSDYGHSETPAWGGFSGLPGGYWVYVYPHWYVWRDQANGAAAPSGARSWGPEQATGEPDTETAGDLSTAWASLTPDDQDEWLQLEYERPIRPVAVIVHATFNPGALGRVTMSRADTEEVDAWKGADPTPAGSDKGVSILPVKVDFETKLIKIHLDSKRVEGWNEIDAVGLVDQMGKTHWAVRATASSTYASQEEAPDREVRR